MRKLIRLLLLLDIFLSGTQCIVVPWLPLSIFQLFTILTMLLSFPIVAKDFFTSQRGGNNQIFALVWLLSSIMAYIMSINASWARSYVLLGIMTSYLFLAIPCFFSFNDFELLSKTLIRSQYIVIPFSLISYFLFYNMSLIPEKIPLFGGMYIALDEETIMRGTAAGEVRLMLPYATPPVLSIVMAVCITILLFSKDLVGRLERLFLLLSYGAILLFTGSRTGLAGIIIMLLLLFISGDLKKFLRRIPAVWKFLSLLLLVIGSIYMFGNEYFQKMIIGRFTSVSSSSLNDDRHFLVPIDGLLIWIDNIKNFVLGIGFGSSSLMNGKHTYLPPYFLNSYITLLAERGLLGLILVIKLIKHSIKLFHNRKSYSQNEKALLYGLLVALISGMFYENLICYFVIFILAISFIFNKKFIINERN